MKLVTADRRARFAVIPGVFLDPQGGGEAFVQVLDGATGESWYHRYDIAEFGADADRFTCGSAPTASPRTALSSTCRRCGARSASRPRWTRGRSRGAPRASWAGTPGCPRWSASTASCPSGTTSPARFTHAGADHVVRRRPRLPREGLGRGLPLGLRLDADQPLRRARDLPHGVGRPHPVGPLGVPRPHRRAHAPRRACTFATYTGAVTTRLEIDDDEVRWPLRSKQGPCSSSTADRPRGGLLHAPVRTEMHRRVEETLDAHDPRAPARPQRRASCSTTSAPAAASRSTATSTSSSPPTDPPPDDQRLAGGTSAASGRLAQAYARPAPPRRPLDQLGGTSCPFATHRPSDRATCRPAPGSSTLDSSNAGQFPVTFPRAPASPRATPAPRSSSPPRTPPVTPCRCPTASRQAGTPPTSLSVSAEVDARARRGRPARHHHDPPHRSTASSPASRRALRRGGRHRQGRLPRSATRSPASQDITVTATLL